MLSAPAIIPANSAGTFRCGFAPTSPGTFTCPGHELGQPCR
jgi:hypothetical protein